LRVTVDKIIALFWVIIVGYAYSHINSSPVEKRCHYKVKCYSIPCNFCILLCFLPKANALPRDPKGITEGHRKGVPGTMKCWNTTVVHLNNFNLSLDR